ncbi:MAG: mobile mystery protein B [Bdellovibrionales bacterium]
MNDDFDDIFEESEDGTDLTEEEKEGLIPSYISTRGELNQAEQQNIVKGELWAFTKKRNPLDTDFLDMLHKKMYGEVWEWAGTYRKTARNIGIDAYRIGTELKQLVGDTQYQLDHATYSPDELAARFHHRLVFIHPYPNGNGRHSRLATDILLHFMDQERFTWGAGDITKKGEVRTWYINALQAADNHDIEPLLEFGRSE